MKGKEAQLCKELSALFPSDGDFRGFSTRWREKHAVTSYFLLHSLMAAACISMTCVSLEHPLKLQGKEGKRREWRSHDMQVEMKDQAVLLNQVFYFGTLNSPNRKELLLPPL